MFLRRRWSARRRHDHRPECQARFEPGCLLDQDIMTLRSANLWSCPQILLGDRAVPRLNRPIVEFEESVQEAVASDDI
jgi:hypothetical protein